MCNTDQESKNEFITVLALIMYDTSHPLREPVVSGYEEIANVILNLHINKKTYRDIVLSRYGEIPEEEVKVREKELKKEVSFGIMVFKKRLKRYMK